MGIIQQIRKDPLTTLKPVFSSGFFGVWVQKEKPDFLFCSDPLFLLCLPSFIPSFSDSLTWFFVPGSLFLLRSGFALPGSLFLVLCSRLCLTFFVPSFLPFPFSLFPLQSFYPYPFSFLCSFVNSVYSLDYIP